MENTLVLYAILMDLICTKYYFKMSELLVIQKSFVSQKNEFLFDMACFKLKINFAHFVNCIWENNLQGKKVLRNRKTQSQYIHLKYKMTFYS